MKNLLILITALISTSLYAQVENIVNAPACIDNETELYVYGINKDGGIEINILDPNFELLDNFKIESPEGIDPFYALTVQDAGSLLLINGYVKGRGADYFMHHFDKKTKQIKLLGEQGGYFVNENVKVRVKETQDLLLLDHLKIYPYFIDGNDVYIYQQNSKRSLLYYTNYSIAAYTVNCFNNKGNDRLIKCQAVIGEDDGFVWLEKEWEQDLGFESIYGGIRKQGENIILWGVTKKNGIIQHAFDLKNQKVNKFDLNKYSISGLSSKSSIYEHPMKSESSVIFSIDIENNYENLAFIKLDNQLNQIGSINYKSIGETGVKLGLGKTFCNHNYLDYNRAAYFSNAYYKVSNGTASNGTPYSSIEYKETINGYIKDENVVFSHVPRDKREITKEDKKYDIVRNEFVVKNDKIYNLYVHNEFGKVSFGGKKACSFVFYNVENDEFLTGSTLSKTVFFDDMIKKNDPEPNSLFFISKDGKKMLWLAALADDQNVMTGSPRNFKVFIDEL